jgi:polysaccharide deacetylase family protein (PEP-CTERM system associated)
MINALTVDVEDWYQAIETIPFDHWPRYADRVEIGVDLLLDIFARHHVTATFFILGWIAERHPDMVRRIHGQGHEIATHGYSHRFLYDLGPEAFRQELRRSVNILEEIAGVKVLGHRASAWTITPRTDWALDILLEEGLRYDSSITPFRTYLNGYPGKPKGPFIARERDGKRLVEFPYVLAEFLGKAMPVGGGFYTRLFPLWVLRKGIRRVNLAGHSFVFYVHPWDLDVHQPRVKTSLKLSRHYLNLHGTKAKLEALLDEFTFTSMQHILEQSELLAC